MKRSTARGTTALAAAVLIALPVISSAQTPQPSPPPATGQPAAAQPQPPQDHSSHTALEHLRQARAALGGIQDTAVAGTARTRLLELRRHMTALERAAAAPAPATASRGQRRGQPASTNWASDVAAIDRILTQLIGPGATTGAGTQPSTTGTTGTTGTKAQTAVAVDEATRGKLMDVRKHVTAFAAAMSATQAQPPPPVAQAPASTTRTPPQPPAPPTTVEPRVETAPAATVDPEAAKRHLTAARDSLSQLTQLPEAAQLTGAARAQVTQLIANFNELITTQGEWRATYAKVDANLTALLGAERTDESNVPPPTTGTAGAIGTPGIATLDPKIREKLVEVRRHLTEFERAAGGGAPR